MQDDDVGRVLRAAGPREKPPAEIELELRESLRREWRAIVAARRARRRRVTAALAAGLAGAAIGAWVSMPRLAAPVKAVGTVALAVDDFRVKSGWLGRWRNAPAGTAVWTGEVLATGPAGRGALALAGGISARLDQSTQVRVAAVDRLVLDRGALYVDAGTPAKGAMSLVIATSAGSVRHLGTQYEVRLLPAGVRLRVREGRIEWSSGAGSATGQAGEQLTITQQGIERSVVAMHGDQWSWVAQSAPGIDIDGLPLTAFLDWAARELGCRVEFSPSRLAAEASSVVLHGSVAGLDPARALDTVLATTRMQAEVRAGSILVSARD